MAGEEEKKRKSEELVEREHSTNPRKKRDRYDDLNNALTRNYPL